MQADPRYGDVVGEVRGFLRAARRGLRAAGIAREAIVLDPGHRLRQDASSTTWRCCATWARWRDLGFPLLVGVSRKA